MITVTLTKEKREMTKNIYRCHSLHISDHARRVPASVCVCVCVCVCACVRACVRVQACVDVHVFAFVHMCACVHEGTPKLP